MERLDDGADAVIGLAADGGYWLLGLQMPDPTVFLGIAMSAPTTGAAQLARLQQKGRRVACLSTTLTDVDTPGDAFAVAEQAPGTRFALQLRRLQADRSETTTATPGGAGGEGSMDLRGSSCGETLIRLAVQTRTNPAAHRLSVLSDDTATASELAAWCRLTGHHYLHPGPNDHHQLLLNPIGEPR